MLTCVPIGPLPGGGYAAAYQTPGCAVMTVATPCSSFQQATTAAEEINQQQARREAAMRRDQELRGLRLISNDLKGL